MKNQNQRSISARIMNLLSADSVPLSDAWKTLIDDAEHVELQEHRKPQKPIVTFYSEGIAAAANWVDQQRESYDNEHGHRDNDTGSFEFGNDAQRDYSDTLAEIAEGIRALHPSTSGGEQETRVTAGGRFTKFNHPELGATIAVDGEPLSMECVVNSLNTMQAELQRRKAAAEPVAYRKFVKDDCNSLLDGYEYFDSQGKSGSREPLYAAPQPAPIDIDRLQESAYKAGLTAGWNFGIEHNSGGFSKCLAAHEYAAPQLSGITEQLNQAPVKQPASKCPKCGDRGTYYDSQMRGSVFCDHVLKLVSAPYKLPPNSFTDGDLEAMAHGDNPQSNAYRELLAFRRNSPVTPDGSACKYCGGSGYFRWQQSENMCPCPCKGCTELVAPQLGGKDD
jgi:hypothetical protein